MPRILFLEGIKSDILDFDWLSYHRKYYISPPTKCIERACSGASHPWYEYDVLGYFQKSTSGFSLALIESPTYVYLMFDVYLFWFVAKHKGRVHGVNYIMSRCYF